MVADIIIAIAGPAIGGVIAAVAGWKVTERDREKAREAHKKRWYRSVFRLSQEINTSIQTAGFMKLDTDKQRLIQEFTLIAEQLDKERYAAPLDADTGLISALANTAKYARRLNLDVSDARMKQYHYKMLEYAEEIQYYVQKEVGDDLPSTFNQDRMEEIEERIKTRSEMSRDEWRSEETTRIANELREQQRELREK